MKFKGNEHKKSRLRTKAALSDAFLTLLSKKTFDEISVSNIIDLAGYSRTTFYSYYQDKYDMIDKMIDDEVVAFVNAVCHPIPNDSYMRLDSDIYLPGLSLFEHVLEQKALYYALIHYLLPGYSTDLFCLRMSKVFQQVISITLPEEIPELNFPLYCYITGDSYLAFIKYWELHDFSFTPEYLARQMMSNWVKIKKVSSVSIKPLPSTFNIMDIFD